MRWALGVTAAIALAVGLTVCALPLWLRTGAGHRTVERLVTRLLNERVPGTVSVGRLSGNVIGGLDAEEVVVRNPDGQEVGRARAMSVRWRPLALVRRRVIDELSARHPIVTLDRGRWRTPPQSRPGGRPTTIVRILAYDGRVSGKGATFDHVTGSASLRSSSNLDVHAVSARVGPTRWSGYGVVGWGQGHAAWVATRVAVRAPDHLSGSGEVFYTPGRLEGAIDELTVAAPLATSLVGGRGALHARGELEGAPDQLRARARASQGRRALQLRAVIDGPRRAVTFDARLAGGRRPISVHARARYLGGALLIPALRAAIGSSRLDGSARLGRRVLRATATVRLAPPEARWLGLRTRLPLVAQLGLQGPFAALAVQARARLGAARLTVRAHADVPRRRLHADAVVDDLEPAQLSPGVPALKLSTALTLDGAWRQHALLADLRLARGRIRVGGRSFDQLDGSGHVRLASGGGEVTIQRLSARWASRRGQPLIGAAGLLRWSGEQIALSRATVTLADSRWTGAATWVRAGATGGPRLRVRADAMSLAPDLIAQLLGHRPPQAWVGRAALDGVPDDLTLHAETSSQLGPVRTAVRRQHSGDAARWSVDVQVADSHLGGAAQLRGGRLIAALDELVLAPALVHELSPALDPGWPIRFHGTIGGPLEALDLRLGVDAGPSTAELRGQLSTRTRRFRLTGHVDTFELAVLLRDRSRVRGSLELAAEGQLARGGVVGTLTLRHARGFMLTSPFYRGFADARFDGRSFELTRAHVEIPGAKIAGRGHGADGHGFRIGYGVVITDAFALRHVPTSLKLVIGLNGILPGRTIEGAIEKQPGAKIQVKHHVLPIGASQLVFLYRVLTGGVPDVD